MSLGTVLHSVSSDAGSISFRASEEWEATEVAPGGCDGAKEVISDTWMDRYSHIFVRDAQWLSWHEQSGRCIWGGTIRDTPTENDGRAELSGRGVGQKAERQTGRLLYQSRDLSEWRLGGNTTASVWHGEQRSQELVLKRPGPSSATSSGAGLYWYFEAPDAGANVSRLAFNMDPSTDASSANQADYDFNSGTTTGTINSGTAADFDVAGTESEFAQILVADPASYLDTDILEVSFTDVRVNGIAPGDTFTASSAAKDLCQRLRVKPWDIDEFGFNVLPLDFKDGESFAEAFDYIALLANARWLILHNGSHAYLDFGKFSKRVWETWDSHTPIDLLPLERFDRISIPWKYPDAKQKEWVQVIADDPFTSPNGYGRLRMKDAKPDSTQAQELGERLLPALYEQRWGGSAQLATVGLEGGDRQSAFFLHAGDILRVPQRRARARVARKSMTIRGVTVEFEANYAALDSYLARQTKRQEAA